MMEPESDIQVGGHLIRVLKMENLPYPVEVLLHNPNRPRKPPRLTGTELDVNYDGGEERHEALGKFMASWSRLEQCIAMLAEKLFGTSVLDTRIVFTNIGMRQIIEILKSLSAAKLAPPSAGTLEAISGRLIQMNQTRNRLVHGHWVLEAKICAWAGEVFLRTEFSRQSRPPNPDQANQMGNLRNQKIRSQFCFNIKRINGAARDVDALNMHILKFQNEMKFTPDRQNDLRPQ